MNRRDPPSLRVQGTQTRTLGHVLTYFTTRVSVRALNTGRTVSQGPGAGSTTHAGDTRLLGLEILGKTSTLN